MKIWTTARGTRVARVLLGRSNVYCVSKGGGVLLVDTGWRRAWPRLSRALASVERDFGRPELLFLTHSHADHVENAARLAQRYGLPVLVHQAEAARLDAGDSPIPRGSIPATRWLLKVFGRFSERFRRFDRAAPNLVFCEPFPVNRLWSAGEDSWEVLPTPGHSPGSSCLIVDGEIALVGDTLFGVFPHAVFPPYADDPEEMVQSWRLLLETGAQWFLPGHGRPIPRARLEAQYLQCRVQCLGRFTR